MKIRRKMTVTVTLNATETQHVSAILNAGMQYADTQKLSAELDTATNFLHAITLEGEFYDSHPIGKSRPITTSRTTK